MPVRPLAAKASFLRLALVFFMRSPGSGVGDLIDCSAMAGGEKDVELVALWCERKRVRALFGRYASELLHRLRVEHVDGARVAYRDVEAFVYAIEEHDIWGAAQGILTQDFSGRRIERDQHS